MNHSSLSAFMTPSGTNRHRKSTKPENCETAKISSSSHGPVQIVFHVKQQQHFTLSSA